MISARLEPSAETLNSAISRAIVSSGSRSRILITLTSLCSCLVTWSIGCEAPSSVIVMRETDSSSVGPTASVSMLKPRRANRPAMRVSTPGLFSTSTDSTCLRPGVDVARGLEVLEAQDFFCSWLAHQPTMSLRGGAGGDHRVAVLLLAHAHVEHHRALGARSPRASRPRPRRPGSTRMPRAPNASASFTQSGLEPMSTEL